MFGAGHFGNNQFAPSHFYGGGVGALGATVTTTWRTKTGVLAGDDLDYWIIDSMDEIVASGSETTDASGNLVVYLPQRYVGESVLVVMNNLAADMEPDGRIQGQQVKPAT